MVKKKKWKCVDKAAFSSLYPCGEIRNKLLLWTRLNTSITTSCVESKWLTISKTHARVSGGSSLRSHTQDLLVFGSCMTPFCVTAHSHYHFPIFAPRWIIAADRPKSSVVDISALPSFPHGCSALPFLHKRCRPLNYIKWWWVTSLTLRGANAKKEGFSTFYICICGVQSFSSQIGLTHTTTTQTILENLSTACSTALCFPIKQSMK